MTMMSYGYLEPFKNYVNLNAKKDIFLHQKILYSSIYPILQNRLDMIQFIWGHYSKLSHFASTILQSASINTKFRTAQYIAEQHFDGNPTIPHKELQDVINYSMLYGYGEESDRMFKYLVTTFKIYTVPNNTLEDAIKYQRFEKIKTLHEYGQINCLPNIAEIAAYNSKFDYVEYFCQRHSRTITSKTLDILAKYNQMNLLLTLRPLAPSGVDFTPDAIDYVAMNNHLDMLKWLNENSTVGCTKQAMDWAAERNHIEIVKFLHGNRTEGCTTNAIDLACQSGHFEMVKWLHENRSEGCTKEAMSRAAIHGHFEIVKWLHENRTEGCSHAALESAAKKNHLEVVKFLIGNRTEGEITKRSLQLIAGNGHLEMARYIIENRVIKDKRGVDYPFSYLIDDGITDSVIIRNHQDLLQYFLQYNTTYQCSDSAMKKIVACGNCAILKILLDGDRLKKVSINIQSAILGNHLDMIKFIYDNKLPINKNSRPLYYAAYERKHEILAYLVENQLCKSELQTVTNLAVLHLDHHYARYLFEHSPIKPPFIHKIGITKVIERGNQDMINLFLEYDIIKEKDLKNK